MEEWDWSTYLEREGAISVPEHLFEHVENSIKNGIEPGMLLETAHANNPSVYWIAEINLVCGHMLFLKYIGAERGFWCDMTTSKMHPLGWCGKYEEPVEPPDDVNVRHGDSIIELMKKTLMDGVSVSEAALNRQGLSPIDRVKPGMKVEVQNSVDPFRYWIATVERNVGGRLLLRYDGSDDDDVEKPWIFYGSQRLANFHFVTSKGTPWQYKYPGKINKFSCKTKLSAQLRQCAEESIKDPTPADLFEPKVKTESHNFITGMKLEALDPRDHGSVRPATVVKVYNAFHFLVVIDDHLADYEETKMAWLCDLLHPYIYPVNWAASNSMPFTVPRIWDDRSEFDWDEYLTQTSSVPAPEYCFGPKNGASGLEVGMRLEAVHPTDHSEIHAASIDRVVENMVGVSLLSSGERAWYADTSDLLLPVNWCHTNDYPLRTPRDRGDAAPETRRERPPPPSDETEEETCDRIYFNYKCYAGPMISRNKLSQLPKHVGPGPLSLVMKEVLNLMVSASYKPARMLKDWECEGPVQQGMRLETLKAKLKTSTHYADVQVVTNARRVAEFCRSMCGKMAACPHLFGPDHYPERCPENCLTKDKCEFQNGNRLGRGRARRRKKLMASRTKEPPPETEDKDKEDSGNESENSNASTSRHSTRPNTPDSGGKPGRKKRETRTDYPKLEVKTRGAKPPSLAQQVCAAHWTKKDVDGAPPKRDDTDSERSSSSKHISDVSDGEEPELKKLKFRCQDDPPSDGSSSSAPWTTELRLPANPAEWSPRDVHKYLSSTDDCRAMADAIRHQDIDGPAFIMLNLPTIEEFLHLRTKYALLLCKHVTKLKLHYIMHFQESSP